MSVLKNSFKKEAKKEKERIGDLWQIMIWPSAQLGCQKRKRERKWGRRNKDIKTESLQNG